MPRCPNEWISEFLHRRQLERPDGRALYAHRCTAEEFESLRETLAQVDPCHSEARSIEAFVLYAAEWWQREYDGGHWAWEPLLQSIGWRIDYPDLYESVRTALRWWQVGLVRSETSTRYLGTFACQGGLPLALVGDAHSKVTQYLRAVLRHTAEYQSFVDDPIDLAKDQQHLLRPPTLRRDYVFRLAAELTTAVLDLRDYAGDEDPLNALDQAHPHWRETMPLDLGNERARELLTGLLREAARVRTSSTDEFRVERFLRRTGNGWRLGARIQPPAVVPTDYLAHQLGTPKDDLPPRLEVRLQGDRVHVVGLYAKSPDNDDYVWSSRGTREIWDAEATAEVRLQFLSKGVFGEGVVPNRGSALGELPWIFREDANECPFIGEGSVSNRAPELVALVPEGCTTDQKADGLTESDIPSMTTDIRVMDRILWRIAKLTAIETGSGRCVIRPASQPVEEEYRLTGKRFYNLNTNWPLFRGQPAMRIAKPGQTTPRMVPVEEISWRRTGEDWQQHPDTFGLWEVRHVCNGELRYLGRIGRLPEQFDSRIEPGSDMREGHLIFNGAKGARISGGEGETEVAAQVEGDTVRVHIFSQETSPPAHVRLRLHWRGATPLSVFAPFPGQGGRFLRNGQPLEGGIVVDDLYGVWAIALSPDNFQKFWIEGDLKAPDEGLLRVAHFRLQLHQSGAIYELPLIDVRPMIELLLASSSSSAARVTLRIVDRHGKEHGITHVSRFAAALEYDVDVAFVSMKPELIHEPAETFEALPIARPNDDPVPLNVIQSDGAPHGAILSQDLNIKEPWLVVARHDDRVRIQPVTIGGNDDPVENPSLCSAISLGNRDSRMRAIAEAMDAMLTIEDAECDDREWAFLTDTLLRAEELPATALDIITALIMNPRLLVRCMFRLDSAPRQLLWRLEDELPFSWLLIKREIWWSEAKQAVDRLRDQLANAMDDQIACEHVNSILEEGAKRISALNTVATDVALRLQGGRLSKEFVEMVELERDRRTPEQIRIRAAQNDWPEGDGRKEWQKELERGDLLKTRWQHPDELRPRQPILDTPIAAAWCCFLAQPTKRTTFLVKRIRAHDDQWFDWAYSAAWYRLALIQDGAKTK